MDVFTFIYWLSYFIFLLIEFQYAFSLTLHQHMMFIIIVFDGFKFSFLFSPKGSGTECDDSVGNFCNFLIRLQLMAKQKCSLE